MQPINIINGSWKQGVEPKVVNLTGTAFMEEAGAHVFHISAEDASGATIAFTGTVSALFLRADNTTVAIDGEISEGAAEVTLVSDCYHVPGRFSIAVYVSDGTDSACVYAAVGNVYRTSSDVVIDSGATIPTLAQLQAAYQACVEATADAEGAAEEAIGNFAPAFAEATANVAGSYVTYTDGKMYLLPNGHTANTTWANTTKSEVKVGGELTDLKGAVDVNDAAIKALQDVENVPVNMIRNRKIDIESKVITDAGGGFYLSDPITVSEGELYIITCEGYGYAAAYAFGDEGVISYVFPESLINTTNVNLVENKLIVIPAGVTELYVSNTTYGDVIVPSVNKAVYHDFDTLESRVDVCEDNIAEIKDNITHTNVCIDATDTGSYETAPSTRSFPHPYPFVAGKKYKAKLTINHAAFIAQNDAIRVQQSPVIGDSAVSLLGFVFRINPEQITDGAVFETEFIAAEGCVNLLARYKFGAGEQSIDLDVTMTEYITADVEDIKEDVQNKYDECIIKSRMLMGAHRGAEHFAPPNCVAAYEIAGKMGFPWAWLAQIRWSSSGTLYVMHDADVSITTNGTGNIQDLTDEYINSLLCNKITGYDYSQFTDDDLRVPTLEKAIQICLRYGMKMCFRIEPFPNQIETELHQTIWDNFERLVKEYGISADWCCYSGYNYAEMIRCITLFGEDAELCPYLGAVSAQDVVDWFNNITSVTVKNKSILLNASNITLADVKLLHANGIKVYAFTNSTTPTQELMEQFATWGVDILQNPRYARIPIA